MARQFDIAADLDTPVSAFLKLAPFDPRFLLESVEGAERLARYSFIGLGSAFELRIADDFGEELPQGAHGEILIRGQNVMAGYLDEKLATAHVMRGDWLHTGDIGFVDEEGRLTIADRTKDLILRGGASIYPSEIENVLAHHPATHDVAVVGQLDDYYGEEIVAVIVRKADVTARELDEWVREQLAPYKVPRRYAFIEALPQGASGKTLKRQLRDQLVSGELTADSLPKHGPTK